MRQNDIPVYPLWDTVTESNKPGDAGLDALASTAASDPAEASVSLRDRLIATSHRPGRYGLFVDRIARLFALPVEEATRLLDGLEKNEGWMPFLVPGTELISVQPGAELEGAIATFMKVPPGVRFPEHVHRGVETMVVLDGGFVEPDSKIEAWRGEETTREDGTEHALVGLPGVPCIVAAVIRGHADFK